MNLLNGGLDERIEAELPPAERRWLKWLRRVGGMLIGVYFVVAFGLLAVRFWILPSIADYKVEIAAAVSRALGERVEIAGIKAGWRGFRPRLELDGVKVFDRRGDEALALPYVNVTVSWRSLAVGELRFKSLVLDWPDLVIRRDPQGRMFVAGLELKPEERPDGSAADWLLRQDEIVIRDATLEWSDELRGAVPIRLERVEFVLQNKGRHHRFALRAQPPADYASMIDIRGDLLGRTVEQLREWNGELYAAFDYIDLAAWQKWVDYPIEVNSGRGALRLWLGFGEGVLTQLTADVALGDLSARFAKDLPLLEMQTVRGEFGARKRVAFELIDLDGKPDISYEAFARQLALVTKGGVDLAPADFTARWKPAQEQSPEHGEVIATSIEIAPIAQLVEYMPLPTVVRHALVAMQPEGRLSDLRFDWTGDIETPASYRARGRFAGFGMRPYRAAPGFNQLAGTFDFTEQGGTATIGGEHVAIDYPGEFIERTIAFDKIGGRATWHFPNGALELRVSDVALWNADLAATADGVYRGGEKGVRGVDISARIARADGKSVYKYIPGLPAPAADWLKRGILSGAVSEGRLRLRGDLADFPYDDPTKGEFKITAHVTGGTLDYAPGWPGFTNVTADLLFDGRKLRITSPRANAFGTQLSNVVVSIPDLYGSHTDLVIDGHAGGPLADFLKFIAQSPVRGFLDGRTDGWSGDGAAKLALHVDLPLYDLAQLKVIGSFQFANNSITMGPGEPVLARVNGRVEFTEAGARARGLMAQALGGAITVQLSPREGGIGAVVQGTVDSVQLARTLELPIAQFLHGPITFRYAITRAPRTSQLAFESSLSGVAIDLPPPFAKPAAESWPLKVERTQLSADKAAGTSRDMLSVSLGTILTARALTTRSAGGRPTVERASVGIGGVSAQFPDQPGVVVAADLNTLELDRLIAPFRDSLSKDSGGVPALSAVNLHAGVLTIGGRLIHDVTVRARVNALQLWNATVTARELAGEISWEPEGKGAVAARLKYLVHPDTVADAERADDPLRQLPALAIVADSYVFNGRELGAMDLRAVNEPKGWRLEKLELAAPDGNLSVSGLWQTRVAPERTELDVKIDVKDLGHYLARFGQAETIARGTATLEGSVAWEGPIFRIDYASLSGALTVKAEKGQFVKLKPGVGKLLGVLSLQSLPRRITLDFRDVFSEGFAFDAITGTAKIAQGVATTKNLAMSGPAASVAIHGEADLAHETQDLNVRIVPLVGDAFAVATGVALLNPIAGVGALLAQRLLKDPLGQMLAYEYQVTGSWEEPKVIKVRAPPRVEEPATPAGGAQEVK